MRIADVQAQRLVDCGTKFGPTARVVALAGNGADKTLYVVSPRARSRGYSSGWFDLVCFVTLMLLMAGALLM
jgi:hypothetical protein